MRKNNPKLATANNEKLFSAACTKCANAANSCPANGEVPKECKGGLDNAAIKKCVVDLAAGR